MVVSGETWELVTKKTENCLLDHIKYLSSIGKVVNESKTELMYYSKNSLNHNLLFVINGCSVTATRTLKAIGVLLDSKMSWDDHMHQVVKKSNQLISTFSFIR